MSELTEPDGRFVERLDWQLASEYRRLNRLKPASGKIAVPRRMVAVTLLVGVLLAGVTVIKAADYIRDSWRKKIEIARVETEVKLKTAHLELTRELASQAEARFSLGVIDEAEFQLRKRQAEKAALALDRSLLNRDEVKASGELPRDELYAPVVGGRDFVSERLKLERKELELDLEALKRSLGRFEKLVEVGVAPKDQLDAHRADIADRKALLDQIQTRLALRQRFLKGQITAQAVDIEDRIAVAASDLSQARSRVDSLKGQLESLLPREAMGLVSGTEVQQLRYALDAAQAELSLAAMEMDVLNKAK
jgi:multidrug resistance efflux pump